MCIYLYCIFNFSSWFIYSILDIERVCVFTKCEVNGLAPPSIFGTSKMGRSSPFLGRGARTRSFWCRKGCHVEMPQLYHLEAGWPKTCLETRMPSSAWISLKDWGYSSDFLWYHVVLMDFMYGGIWRFSTPECRSTSELLTNFLSNAFYERRNVHADGCCDRTGR